MLKIISNKRCSKLQLFSLFILVLSLIGFNVQAAPSTEKPTSAQEDKLPPGIQKNDAVILIQSAKSAIIEQDKTQPNLYKITLKNVVPFVSFVGDRPNRNVGNISLERYLKLWQAEGQNSFRNSPPNAIFHVISGQNSTPGYFALELSEPKYNAQTNTLEYKAKALMGDKSNIPANASFDHITIIIDDVCIGCWN